MCRSIKRLRRPDEVPTADEVRAAARQFVRKVSGFNTPSRIHEKAFERAIAEISAATETMLETMGKSRPTRRTAVVADDRSLITDH